MSRQLALWFSDCRGSGEESVFSLSFEKAVLVFFKR